MQDKNFQYGLEFGSRPADTFEATYQEFIAADITEAQAHLHELPESEQRGLTLETLRHFGCGYLSKWIYPKSRAEFVCGEYMRDELPIGDDQSVDAIKTLPRPSRRIIIPTPSMKHYNAVILPADRHTTDRPKPHAGKKNELFCDADALKQDFFVVVEGEIDAMSIWQASGGKIPVVAILSAKGWKNTLVPRLKDLRGKKIILLLDGDAAGRKAAQELRDNLIGRGFVTATSFLYDALPKQRCNDWCGNSKKIDANDILTAREGGGDYLNRLCEQIISRADFSLALARIKEIEQIRAENATLPEPKMPVRAIGNNQRSMTAGKATVGIGDSFADVSDLIDRIKETITYADLEAKGYLRHSENGDPEPNGYICPWCGSGTHASKTGALTYYDTPEPHFTCHAQGCGGDVIKFLSKIYGIDNHGKAFYELLHRAAEDFGIPYEPRQGETVIAENATANGDEPAADDGNGDKSKTFADVSDEANAKRLANMFGDRLRYLQDADKWLTYSGGFWTKSPNSRNSAVMPFIAQAAEILNAEAQNRADKKIAACFKNVKKATPAITYLKGLKSVIVTQADLDNHPYLFNCLNGVVDLQTGKLLPADSSLLLTRQAAAEFRGIDYRDPDNLAEKFLKDIMPNDETREGLLRFLGYALSGVIREQVAQFWRGDGANGKSTLINLLMEVLNTYATKIPNAAILASNKPADADRATTALNSLDGARLAIFDELPQNARLNTALFKTLAGGDKITIRRLHEEGITIKPTAKIILSGNFNPQLDNTGDFGCSRKIRNMPFGETFTGERADDRLLEKLLTADARAALLALLVDAARRWYQHGLTESAQMKAAKTDYLAENDFLEEFISENCEFGDGFIELKIFVRKLRDAYEDETRTISDRNLKDMLKRRLDGKDGVKYGLHHKTRRAGFHGIHWNDIAAYDFGGTPINPKDEDIPDFTR